MKEELKEIGATAKEIGTATKDKIVGIGNSLKERFERADIVNKNLYKELDEIKDMRNNIRLDDNDILLEKKMFAMLADIIDDIKKLFIAYKKINLTNEIGNEITKSERNSLSDKIIEEIKKNEQLSVYFKNIENERRVKDIVDNNIDRTVEKIEEKISNSDLSNIDENQLKDEIINETKLDLEDVSKERQESERRQDYKDTDKSHNEDVKAEKLDSHKATESNTNKSRHRQ